MNWKFFFRQKFIAMKLTRKCDFFIAGFEKCLTTSVFETMNQHPNIRGAYRKEVHYFDHGTSFRRIHDDNSYHHSFPLVFKWSSNRMIEASPSYANESSILKVLNYNPHAKFCFLLRNPVDRFISSWRMHHMNFNSESRYRGARVWDCRPLDEVVQEELRVWNTHRYEKINRWNPRKPSYLMDGCYGLHLKKAFELIPEKQRRVFIVEEDVLQQTEAFFQELIEFFDLSPSPLQLTHSNQSPTFEAGIESLRSLQEFYKSDIALTGKLLNRDLSIWRT